MATVKTYNLTITQTRPDTDTPWYNRELSSEWSDAWKALNYYDTEVTIDQGLLEGQEPYTTMIAQPKITVIFHDMLSDDKLTKTRRYLHIPEDVYNEFIALLNDDTSGLSSERRFNEDHGITHELATKEEVQEIEATP